MNKDTDISRTEPGDGDQLDPSRAAAIMEEAREHALRELRTSYPVLFAVWGLVLLIGYGVIWLSVLGQHPYSGPTPLSLVVLTLLIAAGGATTVIMVGRAVTGVGGASAAARRIRSLAVLLAYVGVFTIEGGLAHAGASSKLLGLYGAVVPMLVVGVVSAASPAVWQDWSTRGLGVWLVIVAAGSSYVGPVGVWGVAGLAAGAGFLVLAAVRRARERA